MKRPVYAVCRLLVLALFKIYLRVRARRVDAPPGADHVIVEPVRPGGSLLSADPALLAALQDAVRRVAAELVRQHGACHVEAHVGSADEGLRWHVIAPGR